MFLAISFLLALSFAAIKPLGDGLFDTSNWVAKILAPADTDDELAKQLTKFGQAALMDGWLSNVPFLAGLLLIASIGTAFFYRWWATILMYFVCGLLSATTKHFGTRSVSHYLAIIYHSMLNRVANYKRENDTLRLEASESYCRDIEQILELYIGSQVRPPTPKQLRNIPCGDISYWLNHR